MTRILNAEPDSYSTDARALLTSIGDLHEEQCDRSRLLRLLPGFDVLIVRLGHRVDAELLCQAPRLRVLVTATTGLNHVDLDAVQRHGVTVLCLKGEREFLDRVTATAELTWALLLAVVRRLPAADRHVRSGHWQRDCFRGHQLSGKTLGIVGIGRLGSIVAEYALAFRMSVLAADPAVGTMPEGVIGTDLLSLLQKSDAVSIHANLEPDNTGLLDRQAFASMKPGAVLINTARGELIDETALLEALESGRLAGAGLDVLAGEAEQTAHWPRDSAVWEYARRHDNLVLTPHIGGATVESMADAELFMAEKLQRFLEHAGTTRT